MFYFALGLSIFSFLVIYTIKLRRSQRALTESETKLANILNSLNVYVYTKDLQGKYLYVNELVCQLFGTSEENIIGFTDDRFFDAKTSANFKKNDQRVLQGEVIKVEEVNTLNNSPLVSTYMSSKQPIRNARGDICGLLGVSTDISELINAKKAADNANVAKSRFLANMSHEIRTPLNGILGVCQLMQKTSLNKKQHELMEMLSDSGNSLVGIIGDILDFSKIESGKLELEKIEFDLSELIEHVVKLLYPSASRKNLSIDFEKDNNNWSLLGDKVRITQIVTNLLGNAIKFTRVGNISIRLTLNSKITDKICFTVSIRDTGIGLSKEQIDIIFDEFSQADSSMTRKYGGTGLGLAISQKIINLMQGKLDVNSELGKGSTFSFTLTLDSVKFPKEKTFHEDSEQNRSQSDVLLVEDDRVNQIIASKMFKQLNCKVTIVSNGKEAVSILESKSFDIVFMDIQMPIMNGYEATQAIRDKDNNCTIIAMTANVMKEDREHCLDVGMNDFISKPIKIEDIGKALSKWID